MYTLPSKLKLFAIILMVIGALGIVTGFLSTPSTTAEVKEMIASDHHHGGHNAEAAHNKEPETIAKSHNNETTANNDEAHYEHTLKQLQNRPWSALYIASFLFFMISLGVLAFYAIQIASQAGWSPVLFRVMEGITSYLIPGGIIMLVLVLLSAFNFNHLFIWADSNIMAHDEILQEKSGWLNSGGLAIRAIIFFIGWIGYRQYSLKLSRKQDDSTEDKWYKKHFKSSVLFLLFFIYTESFLSWDWLMSLDPHWFSSLFGWYVFAGMIVCAITTIAMVTMVLKSQGYLKFVNNSHIHDLAKFMFGFSIFWTYLWFSQFMLIWYANIPEEATYFVTRIDEYKLPFFGMLVMNFVFPILILMNSDYKRINWFVIMAGVVILVGHYIDLFVIVMPSTVGNSWYIGIPEISSVLFFLGLFIFVVFTALTKAPLLAKGNPFIKESKQFHY